MSYIDGVIDEFKKKIEQDSKSIEKQKKLGVDFPAQTVKLFVEHLDESISNEDDKKEILEFLFLNNPNNRIEAAFNYEKNSQTTLEEKKTRISKLTSEMNKIKNQIKTEKEEEKIRELECLFENKKKEISILRNEVRIQTNNPSNTIFYKNLCSSLFLNGNGSLNGRIKNENLNDKFLFLLKNRPDLIPEKSELLRFDKQNVDGTNGYTVEILSKDNIAENLAFGVTTPCCLNLIASGTKYLYLSLFDPNTSMVVVKDKNGKAIATSLITTNGKEIGVWHIDSPNNSKIKKEDVKKSIDFLCSELKNRKSVFMAPGEATLPNLKFLDQQNTKYINEYLLKDLINKDFYELDQNHEQNRELTKKINQELEDDYEYNEYLLNCRNEYEKSDLFYDSIVSANEAINEAMKDTQNKVKEKVEQAVGSGRTDVGDFQYFAYALENINELTEAGKDTLNEFISSKTGWKHKKEYTPMSDKFRANKNEGHGLCQTQFYL